MPLIKFRSSQEENFFLDNSNKSRDILARTIYDFWPSDPNLFLSWVARYVRDLVHAPKEEDNVKVKKKETKIFWISLTSRVIIDQCISNKQRDIVGSPASSYVHENRNRLIVGKKWAFLSMLLLPSTRALRSVLLLRMTNCSHFDLWAVWKIEILKSQPTKKYVIIIGLCRNVNIGLIMTGPKHTQLITYAISHAEEIDVISPV